MADLHYQVFVDLDATALEGGSIYLGQAYADPETMPIPVFWDSALTVPATQPLRTSGGMIVRDGTPADVYAAESAYSIRVYNRAGNLVWYKATTGGSSNSRLTFPIPTGPKGEDSTVPGPANNTYTSYAALQASDPTRKYAYLAGDIDTPPHPDGPYSNTSGVAGQWRQQPASGIAYGQYGTAPVTTLDTAIARPLSHFGVDPFTTQPQQSRLEYALSEIAAHNLKVKGYPEANYRHDGPLNQGNGQIDWQGATLTAMSNGNNALIVSGDGGIVGNVNLAGGAQSRPPQGAPVPPELSGLVVRDAQNFVINNVKATRAAEGYGFASIGLMYINAKNGRIYNATSEYSWADGSHVTGGSERLRFYGLYVRSCGDDGHATVSYVNDGRICRDIKTFGLVVEDARGRGRSVVGGEDVIDYGSTFERTSSAAVYVVSETGDSVTFGNRNVEILGITARDCVTGIGKDPSFNQPIILMLGRSGGATYADGSPASTQTVDCTVEGKVIGAGAKAVNALFSNNLDVVRPRYNLGMANISGTSMGDAVVLGGADGSGWLQVDGCDYAPYILGENLVGDHHYDYLGFYDTFRKGTGVVNNIHAVAGINWDSLYMDRIKGVAARGYQYGPLNLGGPNKTNWRSYRFNGAMIPSPSSS